MPLYIITTTIQCQPILTERSKASKNQSQFDRCRFESRQCLKNPDPSNSLSLRFNPYPLFISYNDATNIRRLDMRRTNNNTKKPFLKTVLPSFVIFTRLIFVFLSPTDFSALTNTWKACLK